MDNASESILLSRQKLRSLEAVIRRNPGVGLQREHRRDEAVDGKDNLAKTEALGHDVLRR